MSLYRSNFQHHQYGVWIAAEFQDNRLKLGTMDEVDGEFMLQLKEVTTPEEQAQNLETFEQAKQWAKQHNNAYFDNVKQAENYLNDLGNEMTF